MPAARPPTARARSFCGPRIQGRLRRHSARTQRFASWPLPLQVKDTPVPAVEYPAVHAHVVAPSALAPPVGQAVHAFNAPAEAEYVLAVQAASR